MWWWFQARGSIRRHSRQASTQTVNISLPSSSSAANASFDAGSSTSSISATKDRTAITARWAAHDDNGDDLTFSLYLRGDGEHVWRLLKDNITEKAYSFDQTLIPDGGYQMRVVASDAPSHTPADALTGEKISERFEVDTTPPVITALKAAEETPCAKAPCAAQVTLRCGGCDVGGGEGGVFAGRGAVAVCGAGGRAVGFEARALRLQGSGCGVQRQDGRASADGAGV